MVDLGQKKADIVCLFLYPNLKGWRAITCFTSFLEDYSEPFSFSQTMFAFFYAQIRRGGEHCNIIKNRKFPASRFIFSHNTSLPFFIPKSEWGGEQLHVLLLFWKILASRFLSLRYCLPFFMPKSEGVASSSRHGSLIPNLMRAVFLFLKHCLSFLRKNERIVRRSHYFFWIFSISKEPIFLKQKKSATKIFDCGFSKLFK